MCVCVCVCVCVYVCVYVCACVCVKLKQKGNVIASGSFDSTVCLWDVRWGRRMSTLPAHTAPVSSLDFAFDGSLLVSASYDGLVRAWDMSSRRCMNTLKHEKGSLFVTHTLFAQRGKERERERFFGLLMCCALLRAQQYVCSTCAVRFCVLTISDHDKPFIFLLQINSHGACVCVCVCSAFGYAIFVC